MAEDEQDDFQTGDSLVANYQQDEATSDRTEFNDHGASLPDYAVRFEERLEVLNTEAAEALYGKVDITDFPQEQRLEFQLAYITAFNDSTEDAADDDRFQAADSLAHQMINPYRELIEKDEATAVLEFLGDQEITVDSIEDRGVDFTTHDVIVIPRDPSQGDAYQLTSEGRVPLASPAPFHPVIIDPADSHEIEALTLDGCEATIRDLLLDSERNPEKTAHEIDEVLIQAAVFTRQHEPETPPEANNDGDNAQDTNLVNDQAYSSDRNQVRERLEQETEFLADAASANYITASVYGPLHDRIRELADDETRDTLLKLTDDLHHIRLDQAMDTTGDQSILNTDQDRFDGLTDLMIGDVAALIAAAENGTGLGTTLPDGFDHSVEPPERLGNPTEIDDFLQDISREIRGRFEHESADRGSVTAADADRSAALISYHLLQLNAAKQQMLDQEADTPSTEDDHSRDDMPADLREHADLALYVLNRMT